MYFLTLQAVFDNKFSKINHIFPAQPTNLNKTKNKEATTKYLDLYKLEIFLSVLRDDYIWTASVDIYISV